MGSVFAGDLSASGLSLEQQVGVHLRCNFYPPVPSMMIDVCLKAIDAFNNGSSDQVITLPEGVTYRGRATVEPWCVVDSYRLGAWLR